jgi:hypothetical protein
MRSCRRAGAAFSAGVLSAALAVAGCGSSGPAKVSPQAYVTSVCKAVGPLESDLKSKVGKLESSLGAVKNASQGKALLQSFLGSVSSDTGSALKQVKSAGVPNVPNGKQISSELVQVFQRLDGAIKSAQKEAASLPTSSPSAFEAGAAKLGSSIQSSVGGITAGLSTLKSPQLEKAAAKSPACRALGA